MTPPHPDPKVPVPGRRSSVRVVLLAMFVTAALYAGALPVYLFFRIRAAASGLAERAEAVVPLLQDVAHRADVVDGGVRAAQRAVETRSALGNGMVDSLNGLIAGGLARKQADRTQATPSDLIRALERSDQHLTEIAEGLAATTQLIQARKWSEAAARLRRVDSLDNVADREALLVAAIGRRDVLERQIALEQVTAEAVRDSALWLMLGLGLAWFGLIVIQRRILHPLRALERGLARVSEGDLNTQVVVQGSDEIALLGAHFNDMTEVLLGRAEEQGRFAAAGQLLADVAHEVGNPLMAIAALAETGMGDSAARSGQRDEMQQILLQAQRATKLLRGLLRFVRPTQRQVSIINVNDVARGALDVVSYRFTVDEITVGVALDPGLPPVECDAVGLEQAVVNLLSNAMDALRAIKPPRTLAVDTWTSDGNVSLAVTDNGPGVAPELLGRLFRPFASTKGRRGAGLGLYISRQIAREAGGDLLLEAAPGGSARFVLTVPAARAVAPPPPPPPAVPAIPVPTQRLAGVRILLVDDEEAVRRPMAKLLKRRGAHVHEAGDGVEALALLAREPVDVILADLRMPRMSGRELLVALEQDRPHLARRLLFLSGDVTQLEDAGGPPVPGDRVLVKPVELTELERRVAEFMAASGAA